MKYYHHHSSMRRYFLKMMLLNNETHKLSVEISYESNMYCIVTYKYGIALTLFSPIDPRRHRLAKITNTI